MKNFNPHVENYNNIMNAFSNFLDYFLDVSRNSAGKLILRFLGNICSFLFSNKIECTGTTSANVDIVLFGISIAKKHVLKGVIHGINFFLRNERRNRFRYFLKE